MLSSGLSRRDFLKGIGAAGALAGLAACSRLPSVPSSKMREGRFISSDKRLNVAGIGCGGKGKSDLEGLESQNIVALCDVVDLPRGAEELYARHRDARRFKDYREMLVEMDDEIDAVTISTPDHTHFPAAMMAIQMGKHVYVQKPLTHTIWEARQLTLAAREHKVATMMGNQGHSREGCRLTYEWVHAGAIGPVHEVHMWTDRPIWPQGIERPSDTPAVPSDLDWNLWLGTAPERPYNPAYVPFAWRGWWDFGTGALGDMGCHIMDAAFWTLDLSAPACVEAISSPVNDQSAPAWSIVTYQYPARGEMPACKVVWYDGGKKPERPKELEEGRELDTNGMLMVGEKGTILADTYGGSPRIIPETKMRDFLPNRPEKTLPRSPGHYEEFIRACKGGEPAGSNFDYAGPLTEMVLLGNLAIRTGQKIDWVAEKMVCTNLRKAKQYVRHGYCKF